jgi:hypothetical protein
VWPVGTLTRILLNKKLIDQAQQGLEANFIIKIRPEGQLWENHRSAES